MRAGCRRTQFLQLPWVFAALYAAWALLSKPEASAQAVAQGLSVCKNSIIPALFPFLVVSQLLLASPCAAWLGMLFLPYTRLLGVHSRKAATALLLGLLGGFAGGASAVGALRRSKELSPREAELLLCCCVNAGPGFIVGGVGTLLLRSAAAGWLLLLSLSAASLLCGGCMRLLFYRAKEPRAAKSAAPPPERTDFPQIMRQAALSTLMLCGYVTFFTFFVQMLAPQASPIVRWFVAAPLEVATACAAAAQTGASRLSLCCAALSCMGASILLQVRALVPSEVRLSPLLLSRLFHLPFSLCLLKALLHFFPAALPSAVMYTPVLRAPPDALFWLFLLCAAFFLLTPPFPHLQRRKKEVK